MIYRKIPNFPNYRALNNGTILIKKTGKFLKPHRPNPRNPDYLCITLHTNGKSKVFVLDKLILSLFKPHELTDVKNSVLHIDNNMINNESKNLKGCTRGDRLRQIYHIKGRKRGVYPYRSGEKLRYRVVIKIEGKIKTIGYRNTEVEARELFDRTMEQQFGFITQRR